MQKISFKYNSPRRQARDEIIYCAYFRAVQNLFMQTVPRAVQLEEAANRPIIGDPINEFMLFCAQ